MSRSTRNESLFATLLAVQCALVEGGWISVPWSPNYYGFDGPWQVVRINVTGNTQTRGSDGTIQLSKSTQQLDMYPYIYVPWSFVLAGNICKGEDASVCGQGGIWQGIPASNVLLNANMKAETSLPGDGGHYSGILNQFDFEWETKNGSVITIPNTRTFMANDSADNGINLQDRSKTLPLEVGMFSFGTHFTDLTVKTITTQQTSLYLQNAGQIASNSWGIHVGSTRYEYPGSLILGGYDRGRGIGSATTISPPYNLPLLDIVLDIDEGKRPWSSFPQRNLLLANRSSLPVSLAMDMSYLSLPQEVCNHFLPHLPILFNATMGYYLWNEQDSRYQQISNSAAYLGFVFPPTAGETANITIKVPLQLLILNLTEAVTGFPNPVPYFPCVPMDDSWSGVWLLGRAFLQAAYVVSNDGLTWLVQAAGPGTEKQGLGFMPQTLDSVNSKPDFMQGETLLRESWAGIWPGKSENGTVQNNATTASPGHQLTMGAEIGVGVGVGIAGLLVLSVVVWWVFRRRRRQTGDQIPWSLPAETDMKRKRSDAPGPRYELHGDSLRWELHGGPAVHELEGSRTDEVKDETKGKEESHPNE